METGTVKKTGKPFEKGDVDVPIKGMMEVLKQDYNKSDFERDFHDKG